MMEDNKVIGRIIKVSKTGWGFISSKDIAFTRIFFHWTALRQDTVSFPELESGMLVEFTPLKVEGKGWRALHIKVLERKKRHADTETPVEEKKEEEDEKETTDLPSL